MRWKEVLRPTIMKIVLLVVLIGLTTFIPKTTSMCSMGPSDVVCGSMPAQGIGYPMFFGTKYLGDAGIVGIYPVNLLVNIVVFYLLSCGIALLYHRARKK